MYSRTGTRGCVHACARTGFESAENGSLGHTVHKKQHNFEHFSLTVSLNHSGCCFCVNDLTPKDVQRKWSQFMSVTVSDIPDFVFSNIRGSCEVFIEHDGSAPHLWTSRIPTYTCTYKNSLVSSYKSCKTSTLA